MAEARLNVEITADAGAALGDLGRLENRIESIGRAVSGANLGESLNRIGAGMTSVGQQLTSTLGRIGGSILQTAGNFEASMNNVVALTDVAGQEFEMLENQAKKLGATTKFSATEAADAMGFLAMAGFETQQIFDALPGVLQLTAATGGDLATVADQASDILGQFGLKAEEIGRVNDVIAETSRRANVDLGTLFNTFKDAAPIAADVGVSIETAAAAAGILGSAGIKGSQGGTTLKNVMLALVAPSSRAAGTMKELGLQVAKTTDGSLDLVESLRRLEKAGATTAQLKDIFGSDIQLAGVSVLIKNLEELAAAQANLNPKNIEGVAASMAAIKNQGLNAQMQQLASAFESLQLAIADTGLLTDVTKLLGMVTQFISKLAEANPRLLKTGVAIGAIGFAVGAVLIPLGMVVSSVGTLITFLSSGALATAFPTFIAGFKALAVGIWAVLAPLGIIIAKIAIFTGLVVAGAALVYTGIQKLITGFGLLVGKIAEGIRAFEDWIGIPNVISGVLEQISGLLLGYGEKMRQAGSMLMEMLAKGISNAVGKVTGAVSGVFNKVKSFLPSSDAKEGPLSNLTAMGAAIPETLAKGMQMATPQLQNQFASTLAPTAPVSGGSNISSPISVNNNITINGNMNNEQRQDLMAQLDAKAQDLARMLQRVNDDRMRTKYV